MYKKSKYYPYKTKTVIVLYDDYRCSSSNYWEHVNQTYNKNIDLLFHFNDADKFKEIILTDTRFELVQMYRKVQMRKNLITYKVRCTTKSQFLRFPNEETLTMFKLTYLD